MQECFVEISVWNLNQLLFVDDTALVEDSEEKLSGGGK